MSRRESPSGTPRHRKQRRLLKRPAPKTAKKGFPWGMSENTQPMRRQMNEVQTPVAMLHREKIAS